MDCVLLNSQKASDTASHRRLMKLDLQGGVKHHQVKNNLTKDTGLLKSSKVIQHFS